MRAARDQAGDDAAIGVARRLEELPAHQLFVDDAAGLGGVFRFGRNHVDAVAVSQTALDDAVLLHGVGRADEADAGEIAALDRGAQRIGDVEQRQGRRLLHRGRRTMHGVAGDEQEIGAAGGELGRDTGHQGVGLVPLAAALQRRHFVEVERVQQQLGGMDAAEAFLNLAVEELIVDGAGFPAHAAEDADGLHGAKLAGRDARGSITFA